MSDRYPMTEKGYRALQSELQRLKSEERPRIVKAIEVAREHGDLSENAEYDAAKNEQGLLEAKLRDIEMKLANAQVIDISKLSGDKVVFGATVEVLDLDSDQTKKIRIVGEDESDAAHGSISFSSPLARALIGKREGDTVRVTLPGGDREYEICAVTFESQ